MSYIINIINFIFVSQWRSALYIDECQEFIPTRFFYAVLSDIFSVPCVISACNSE